MANGAAEGGRLLAPPEDLGLHAHEAVVVERVHHLQVAVGVTRLHEEPVGGAQLDQQGVELREGRGRIGRDTHRALGDHLQGPSGVPLPQLVDASGLGEALERELLQRLEQHIATIGGPLHERALDERDERRTRPRVRRR